MGPMATERFLDGQLAVVTGGGRGIGAAIADALAEAGARLVLLGRDRAALANRADVMNGARGVRPSSSSATWRTRRRW